MTAEVDYYVRDGSRFVRVDDAPPPWMRDVPPIPTPIRVVDDLTPVDPLEPTADNPVVEVRPGHYRFYAPRCPHGHFVRWAVRHCKPCTRPEARRAR